MALLPQDDEMATVEEVFAFIDSFQWDDERPDQVKTADPPLDSSFEPPNPKDRGMPMPLKSVDSDPKPKPKRKRIRTGWSSSTGLQRRKRAELEFLRAHVKELEAYVEQLKRGDSRSKMTSVKKDHLSVDWREVALEEFDERKKSEETNRVLKSILKQLELVGQNLSY
ncbi:hypothetical protein L917_12902 [Phytophthora nicotianae]|uniref:Uncharacterized protein n=1 Tax=Phytophthora nicotianae TaxID=4792 RepID=W2KUF2_PHYNI|nr:hypothetical protein L917_12902 [Phytophthora nicotianae]